MLSYKRCVFVCRYMRRRARRSRRRSAQPAVWEKRAGGPQPGRGAAATYGLFIHAYIRIGE